MAAAQNKIPIRRTDTEKIQIGGLYDGVKRYYDQNMEMTVVKLVTGDFYVSTEPREMLVTILGSCVAVCFNDTVKHIGGMCHIILPEFNASKVGTPVLRQLVNKLVLYGAEKENLEAKIFGGAVGYPAIRNNNIKFVKEFLKSENIILKAEDIEGEFPRRVHYFADTGRALIRKLKRKEDLMIFDSEKEHLDNYN